MADDNFAERAAQLAVSQAEEKVIKAQRKFEDAQRYGDDVTASKALSKFAKRKEELERLTGANQPQQQPGQLSVAQRNFLSRRAAGGDDITPQRMRDYALAHTRAVNAGLQVDYRNILPPLQNMLTQWATVDCRRSMKEPLPRSRELRMRNMHCKRKSSGH